MSSVPESAVPANHQSFLAFDYGLKRTGVAVGNRLMKSATPQGTIAADGGRSSYLKVYAGEE